MNPLASLTLAMLLASSALPDAPKPGRIDLHVTNCPCVVTIDGAEAKRSIFQGAFDAAFTAPIGPHVVVAASPDGSRHAESRLELTAKKRKATLELAVPADPLFEPPVRTTFVDSDYPMTLRSAKIGGTVVFDCSIDSHGATHVNALLSPPSPLDSSARASVEQWRYRPATHAGVPIAIEHVKVTVKFTPGGAR